VGVWFPVPPLTVTDTDSAWAVVMLDAAGATDTVGAANWVALPESPTMCGLPAELSVIVRVELRNPAAVGLKTILIAQEFSGLSAATHVFVSEKSPEGAML
jgi:hypothetical protein